MADWRATGALDPVEKTVVEFAEVLTLTPAEVPDDLTERLTSEFSEKQVVELANLIAWENARARFNRAFGIGPDGYDDTAPDPI